MILGTCSERTVEPIWHTLARSSFSATAFAHTSMPRKTRRYLSYSPEAARKHCTRKVARVECDAFESLGGAAQDMSHHICSFLPLATLVAASCVSRLFADSTVDLLTKELLRLRRSWGPRFKSLTSLRGKFANVVAASLLDDSVERPRTILWAGGVHCIVGFLRRVNLASPCAANAIAILYNLSALPVLPMELREAGGIVPLVDALMLSCQFSTSHGGCSTARFAAVILSRSLAGEASTPDCAQAVHQAFAQHPRALSHLVHLLSQWANAEDSDADGLGVRGDNRRELESIRPMATLLTAMADSSLAHCIALGEAGCVGAAMALLMHTDEAVSLAAATLLCSLMRDHTNRQVMRASPGSLNQLRRLGVTVNVQGEDDDAPVEGSFMPASTGLTPYLARVSVTSRAFRLINE